MDAGRVRRRPLPNRGSFWKGEGVSWEEDATWGGAMGSLGGAHQAGGPALPPQPPPACLALGSSIRPLPPRGPGPLLAPGRPECPPLRPGRRSRAPSRMPHPHPLAFSPSLPSPRRSGRSPGRIPRNGCTPGEGKIGEGGGCLEMQPAACALPVTTPAHPRRESPCSRGRNGGAFPEGPAQLLKKGGHP